MTRKDTLFLQRSLIKLLSMACFIAPLKLWSQVSRVSSDQHGHTTQTQIGLFLDKLGGLPAEYKADLGLAVLEKNWKTMPTPKKLGALNNIFDTATSAIYEAQVKYGAASAESNASQISSNLHAFHVDRLSIQTQSVHLALADMPGIASDLFSRIIVPTRRATCSDPLVEDLGTYYETLGLLMQDSRITSIGGRSKQVFFTDVARETKDPEELAPFVVMLSQMHFHDETVNISVAILADNLENADATDREMRSLGTELGTGMSHLVVSLKDQRISDEKLIGAYRQFLTRNLTKEFCTDASANREHIASDFNSSLLSKSPSTFSKMELRELQPKTAAGGAIDPQIAFDDALRPQVQRIGAAHQARMLEIYQSGLDGSIQPETADVQDILHYIYSIEPMQGTCHVCQFHARAQLLSYLQNTVPPGQNLETVIENEVEFLSFNQIKDEDPPAFLALLKSLVLVAQPPSPETVQKLSKAAKDGIHLFGAPSEEAGFILSELRQSNDPVLRAYVNYEDLFHPTFSLIPGAQP